MRILIASALVAAMALGCTNAESDEADGLNVSARTIELRASSETLAALRVDVWHVDVARDHVVIEGRDVAGLPIKRLEQAVRGDETAASRDRDIALEAFRRDLDASSSPAPEGTSPRMWNQVVCAYYYGMFAYYAVRQDTAMYNYYAERMYGCVEL
jgi:hypothetical protein